MGHGDKLYAFASLYEMVKDLEAAGTVALEVLSQFMKRTGCYIARHLCFKGATFELVTLPAPPAYVKVVDAVTAMWIRARAIALASHEVLAAAYPWHINDLLRRQVANRIDHMQVSQAYRIQGLCVCGVQSAAAYVLQRRRRYVTQITIHADFASTCRVAVCAGCRPQPPGFEERALSSALRLRGSTDSSRA